MSDDMTRKVDEAIEALDARHPGIVRRNLVTTNDPHLVALREQINEAITALRRARETADRIGAAA